MTALANTASAMLAMHARYDMAWDEYDATDNALAATRKASGLGLSFQYEEALRANSDETELLRQSILYQVPTTDEELTVLAFHTWGIFDYDQNSEAERTALGHALTSILDYLVSEGRGDMEKLGTQFTNGAMIAFHKRRYRTGLVGEED